MRSKLEQLKHLKEQLNIDIEGINNYPKDKKTLIVANHNCLMDIFYLPMAIPIEHISVVSSRLVFKKEEERQEVVNKYLHTMPLEANGGIKYANIWLDYITKILTGGGINLNIFPEGGYFPGKKAVYRGKTGASRILFQLRSMGIDVSLVPVAIDIIEHIDLIDCYQGKNNKVKVKVLEPVSYEQELDQFLNTNKKEEKNDALHTVIDRSMQSIANAINVPYINRYMDYVIKNNIILPNGVYVNNPESQNEKYLKMYDEHLKERVKMLYKKLGTNE